MNNSNLEFRKVKSLDFLYEVNENGTILRNVKSKRQIRIKIDTHHSLSGYYVSFVNIKGRIKRVTIYKIVAECWLGDCPEGLQVDHKDRNSLNNDYRNLRYVTHSKQMKNRVLSQRIISQAITNCLNWTMTYIAKSVEITNGKETLKFQSVTQCAKYLGEKYDKTTEAMRFRLKERRKRIFDYDITYLNAETKRTGSKEQEIVQGNLYLVGDWRKRFNNAKQSEVQDRVKHIGV